MPEGESEQVQIVRALLDMFRRGENETPFAYYADDILWDASGFRGVGLAGVYRGHDGIRTFWRNWLDAWESIEWEEAPSITPGPDDTVKVLIKSQRNLGRSSGVWIDQEPYTLTFGFSGNRVVRVSVHVVE